MAELLQKCQDLMGKDTVFWFIALSGSGLFLIQFLINLFGGDAHDNIDDGGGEADTGGFKWLSKLALTGFLMMFGWAGLTCRKEFHFSIVLTSMTALGAGIFSIFITGYIFKLARKLRSSGTVFRIEDAIGKEATVYQRISKGGVGKISISLHDLSYEIDAISYQEQELPSFTQVQIIKKADEKTVVVVPIK